MAESVETESYISIIYDVQEIVSATSGSRDEKLQQIAGILAERVSAFDWVGFYVVASDVQNELVLGSYVGEKTHHTRIPFGRGICGQAAESEATFVVQDVSKEENYLACSMDVKAEIVLPIMNDDAFVAELDIDSHTKHAITKEHEEMLEEICNIISILF